MVFKSEDVPSFWVLNSNKAVLPNTLEATNGFCSPGNSYIN